MLLGKRTWKCASVHATVHRLQLCERKSHGSREKQNETPKPSEEISIEEKLAKDSLTD